MPEATAVSLRTLAYPEADHAAKRRPSRTLERDAAARNRRLTARDECADTFDAETFGKLYPGGDEAMWLKSVINRICRARGWTWSALAAELGMSPSMVTHYRDLPP